GGQRRGGGFLARRPQPSHWRPAARWYPETASLAFTEPLHIRFILRNPPCDLFAGEFAWLRQLGALRPQTGRQEQQQFLLLLRRQGLGCGFDFSKRAHPGTVPQRLPSDNAFRSGIRLWEEASRPGFRVAAIARRGDRQGRI